MHSESVQFILLLQRFLICGVLLTGVLPVLGTDIFLVDGPAPHEGRVEIVYDGYRGCVCDTEWDIRAAEVVCRQLGFTSAVWAGLGEYPPASCKQCLLTDVRCRGGEETLSMCSHRRASGNTCDDDGLAVAYVECSIEGVRLVGGSSPHEGSVLVYHANVWGSVCDYRWSLVNAHVVCRQLGYPHAKLARYEVDFGRSLGLDIVLDVVTCRGDEESLYECEHTAWGVHDSEHVEEAGVVCATDQSIGAIRLVDGTLPNEGRVEVYLEGSWGTVCDHHWDISDANVVCNFLGNHDAVQAPGGAYFGRGSGPINLNRMFCKGEEGSLLQCSHWPVDDDCTHDNDAGVICRSSHDSLPSVIVICGIAIGCACLIGIVVRIFIVCWRRRHPNSAAHSPCVTFNFLRTVTTSVSRRDGTRRASDEDDKYVAFYPFMPPPYSPVDDNPNLEVSDRRQETSYGLSQSQSESQDQGLFGGHGVYEVERSPDNENNLRQSRDNRIQTVQEEQLATDLCRRNDNQIDPLEQQSETSSMNSSRSHNSASSSQRSTSSSSSSSRSLETAPPAYNDALHHQIIGPTRYGGVPMVVYKSIDDCDVSRENTIFENTVFVDQGPE